MHYQSTIKITFMEKRIISVTREFSFEMAHALENYDGACREIHGHSYRLFITIEGTPNTTPNSPKEGMVMDFGELKALVNERVVDRFDHALLLRDTPSNRTLKEVMNQKWRNIELTLYQPTCENMVLFIVDELSDKLPQGVELAKVKLYETAKSYASWTK